MGMLWTCCAAYVAGGVYTSVRVNAWADVPHRNRDHRAYGAVRHVHSFFPYYNVTDARTRAETREKEQPPL